MPLLHVTDNTGEKSTVEGDSGYAVMEILRDNDLGVLALCGGACSCATCHVYIASEWRNKIPAMEENEKSLVEDTEHYREGESRLSCQIELTEQLDGLTLEVAPEE